MQQLPMLPPELAAFIDFDTSECWTWTGPRNPKGYGLTSTKFGSRYAHRTVYLFVHGRLPWGSPTLDHLCRNTACVNPDHLEPVTARENSRRAARSRSEERSWANAAG